jgi:hypothetical protein
MLTTQHMFWAGAGAGVALFGLALLMDWKRSRRLDLDAAGWVPWRGIQVLGMFLALACTVLAIHLQR